MQSYHAVLSGARMPLTELVLKVLQVEVLVLSPLMVRACGCGLSLSSSTRQWC